MSVRGTSSVIACALLANLAHADFLREPLRDPGQECNLYDAEGWLTLFDGTQATAEKYWWISNASHGDGGKWWVAEDPASVTAGKAKAGQKMVWSDQNPGGNGGLLYTQRKYKDFEVAISIFPGWMNDGGLFLRANGKGAAWQVMIDYIAGKTVGGMWPEGLNAPSQDFIGLATETKIDSRGAKWDMNDWLKIWDPDGYNTIQARVKGDPSHINAFIHDSLHPVTDYQTTVQSAIGPTGYIGLQIHAGEASWKGGPNKYQWMKVRELDPATGKPVCPAIPSNKPYHPELNSTQLRSVRAGDMSLAWSGEGNLHVTGPVDADYKLTVADFSGRVVRTVSGQAGMIDSEFPGLAKGIWFVNLAARSGNRTFKAIRF
jgi:hypothetical protein